MIFNHFMEYPKAGDFVFYELMILNSLSQNSKVQGHHKVMQGVFLKSLSISSSRLSDSMPSHTSYSSLFLIMNELLHHSQLDMTIT